MRFWALRVFKSIHDSEGLDTLFYTATRSPNSNVTLVHEIGRALDPNSISVTGDLGTVGVSTSGGAPQFTGDFTFTATTLPATGSDKCGLSPESRNGTVDGDLIVTYDWGGTLHTMKGEDFTGPIQGGRPQTDGLLRVRVRPEISLGAGGVLSDAVVLERHNHGRGSSRGPLRLHQTRDRHRQHQRDRTIGPLPSREGDRRPVLSLSDRGLTFGSNTKRGVCVKFIEPVAVFPPWGTLEPPGLTLTLKDPGGFAAELQGRLTG
jgi:hypothetical protein